MTSQAMSVHAGSRRCMPAAGVTAQPVSRAPRGRGAGVQEGSPSARTHVLMNVSDMKAWYSLMPLTLAEVLRSRAALHRQEGRSGSGLSWGMKERRKIRGSSSSNCVRASDRLPWCCSGSSSSGSKHCMLNKPRQSCAREQGHDAGGGDVIPGHIHRCAPAATQQREPGIRLLLVRVLACRCGWPEALCQGEVNSGGHTSSRMCRPSQPWGGVAWRRG